MNSHETCLGNGNDITSLWSNRQKEQNEEKKPHIRKMLGKKDAVFVSLRVYETIVMKGGHYERTQKGQKSDDLRFFLFESFRFSLEDALE